MIRTTMVLLAAGLAGALASGAALAEKADRDKPINIAADTSTLDDLNKISVLEGNVIITQGTMTIRANKVILKQLSDGTQVATAYGTPVALRQKRDGVDEYVEAFAQRIEYNDRSDLIQLFDDAHVISGKNDVRNAYIAYNMTTEKAEAKCAPGASQCGRARITIQPSRRPPPEESKTTPGSVSPPGTNLKPADELKKPPPN